MLASAGRAQPSTQLLPPGSGSQLLRARSHGQTEDSAPTGSWEEEAGKGTRSSAPREGPVLCSLGDMGGTDAASPLPWLCSWGDSVLCSAQHCVTRSAVTSSAVCDTHSSVCPLSSVTTSAVSPSAVCDTLSCVSDTLSSVCPLSSVTFISVTLSSV